MKNKLAVLLAALLCMVVFALPAAAEKGFTEIKRGNNLTLLIKNGSVKDKGDYVFGQIKAVYAKPIKMPDGKIAVSGIWSYAADKKVKQIKTLAQAMYDSKNKKIYSRAYNFIGAKYRMIKPGSAGVDIWNALIYEATVKPQNAKKTKTKK
ncbi:MAG: hypothetical protein IKT09_00685 [Synergistes sp.]|nr:hypothetical protein [Synergistes sp.]